MESFRGENLFTSIMKSSIFLGIAGLISLGMTACQTTEQDPYYNQDGTYGQGGDYATSGQTGANPYGRTTGTASSGSANGGASAYGSNPYGNNPYSGGGYSTGNGGYNAGSGAYSSGGSGANYNTGGGYNPPQAPAPTYGNSTGGGGSYTVQSGDNLYRIARRFGTTFQAIAGANNISNPDSIRPGQVLVIP